VAHGLAGVAAPVQNPGVGCPTILFYDTALIGSHVKSHQKVPFRNNHRTCSPVAFLREAQPLPEPNMPRISRLRALQTLQLGAVPTARVPFAAFSTTLPARDLRSKLWKGEAPGPEDPYTQRPEPEDSSSNLPDEALQHSYSSTKAHSSSRLVLPPRRTEALTEKELTHNDPTYTPATSIEDLEVAPTLKNWWNQPGHWGEESGFVGFAKAGRVVEEEILEVYLRRAVVEVLALDQAGKLSEWSTKKWSEGTLETLQQTLSASVTVAEDGTASVSGDVSAIVEQLVSDVEDTSVPERISLEEAQSLTRQWDQSWKNLVLNTETKFAVSAPFPLH
jgi:hypothetical protein